jgi:hypothetical protein
VRYVLVVREVATHLCRVEADDPEGVTELCGEGIRQTAAEARQRLCDALAELPRSDRRARHAGSAARNRAGPTLSRARRLSSNATRP